MAQSKLLHSPASGTAFIDSLAEADGHAIMAIDEVGEFICNANNKNSGSHQKKVFKYWLEAFTSQETFIDGERRADSAKEKAKRIDNPIFSLIGTTNQLVLRKALSGEDIGNGMLNRFLFFFSDDDPRKRKSREFNRKESLPDATIKKMQGYLSGLNTIYGAPAQIQPVPFTEEAINLFDNIDDYYEDERRKMDKNNRLRALYGRAHEYVGKLALILSDDVKITVKDVEVAHQIVMLSVKTAIDFCGDIADTLHEEDFIRCRNIIKETGNIKLSEFTIRTQFLSSAKRRDEILQSLYESDMVRIEKSATKGRAATVLHWNLK